MTWAQVWEFIGKAIIVLGGFGVVTGATAAFFGKLFADRSIAKHKAGLDADLEKVKTELGRETERLKSELAKETESHKLKLEKEEILYEKRLEAVTAFFEVHRSIREILYKEQRLDRLALPDHTPGAAERQKRNRLILNVEQFNAVEQKLQDFRAKHAAVLSDDVRQKLDVCLLLKKLTLVSGLKAADENRQKIIDALRMAETNFITEIRNT
jgi:hypothetical protein